MPVFAVEFCSPWSVCAIATPRKLMLTQVGFNSPGTHTHTLVSLGNAKKILIDNEEDTKEERTICSSEIRFLGGDGSNRSGTFANTRAKLQSRAYV